MLEPYEGKLSRTVLREEGRSNVPVLPDQIIENKQRFISQIMTSKTPARSADDIDEATLSYAEIKAIATGNPLIKEKMDIDVKLERLKISRSEFFHAHEKLEHKVKQVYPVHISDAQQILADIKADIETVKQNTIIGDDGKEKFSIILNGKTFEDKKAATNFFAELIKKNKESAFSHCPLQGLSGEYKGLHISAGFNATLSREEILLTGKSNSQRFSSSIASDNINRIIEMANGRTKAAEAKQREIDELNKKIQAGNEELALPFPQQEEYDSLLLRSKELTALLSEDTEATARDKADIQSEKTHRIDIIFNGTPETVCEVRFFNFVKDNFDENTTIAAWSSDSDEAAIQSLVNYGFSKEDISDTVLKFSPAVPSREEVYNMVEDCTRRSAACR